VGSVITDAEQHDADSKRPLQCSAEVNETRGRPAAGLIAAGPLGFLNAIEGLEERYFQ